VVRITRMFASVLIANRGEIACRIARTARRLRMRTIAVYSDADKDALHVRLCDEAHLIGLAPARDSYLRIDKLVEVAHRTGAECVHPGYGFLSENADFAQACADAETTFVGPPPDAMRAMGLKDRAKALMENAGVPVVPGYYGERQEPSFLKQKAYELGYPVLIKAVAGGGGKGMRKVERHAEFEVALEGAIREAEAAFGNGRVLIEKYVAAPRHIEIQVFADRHGNAIHLNERDCSLQRRHQKVVEEAPAPGMMPALREAMGEAAVKAAKAVGYVGAGTVEFVTDKNLGDFWFMEMNTRLQVEHPVTEAITGIDLVEWQFRIAAGEPLPLRQQEVPLQGHAVEARLYAEDPERGFLPSTGKLIALRFPDSVRVDSGVEQGGEVSPFYDPMIAKLIAHAPDRVTALDQLAEALDRTIVAGPRSNLSFLAALCRASDFRAGDFDTGFIETHLAELRAEPQGIDRAAAALGLKYLLKRQRSENASAHPDAWTSPWTSTNGFQFTGERRVSVPVLVDGERATASVSYTEGLSVSVDGIMPADGEVIESDEAVYVVRGGRQTVVRLRDFDAEEGAQGGADGVVRAPMHGKVLEILVDHAARVVKGQRLAIIEAMKMEHVLIAPYDGTVAEIAVETGAQLSEGALVMRLEANGN
jgi:3-methylcrotonyl-CoA carboxylase alpha subunit